MGTTLVKGKKMDQHTVSNQAWEIQYIATKFKLKPLVVRWAKKEIKSKSRRKLYNFLKQLNRNK